MSDAPRGWGWEPYELGWRKPYLLMYGGAGILATVLAATAWTSLTFPMLWPGLILVGAFLLGSLIGQIVLKQGRFQLVVLVVYVLGNSLFKEAIRMLNIPERQESSMAMVNIWFSVGLGLLVLGLWEFRRQRMHADGEAREAEAA